MEGHPFFMGKKIQYCRDVHSSTLIQCHLSENPHTSFCETQHSVSKI